MTFSKYACYILYVSQLSCIVHSSITNNASTTTTTEEELNSTQLSKEFGSQQFDEPKNTLGGVREIETILEEYVEDEFSDEFVYNGTTNEDDLEGDDDYSDGSIVLTSTNLKTKFNITINDVSEKIQSKLLEESQLEEEMSFDLDYKYDENVDLINNHDENVDLINNHVIPVTFEEKPIVYACELPDISTDCRNAFAQFFYDPAQSICVYLNYPKCNEQKSSFPTATECYRQCSNRDIANISLASNKSLNENSLEEPTLTFQGDDFLYYNILNTQPRSSDVLEITFELRTFSAQADVISLIQNPNKKEISPQIFVRIRNGRFGVAIACQGMREEYYMKIGGVQEGAWHTFYVSVNEASGELILQMDVEKESFKSANWLDEKCSFFKLNATSTVWVGGIPKEHFLDSGSKFDQKPLTGCLKILFLSLPFTFGSFGTKSSLGIDAFVSHVMQSDNCIDRCRDSSSNNCSPISSCVDQFFGIKCLSEKNFDNILTLSGSDYMSYRLYDWLDRIHSFSNKFSFTFKTNQPDAVLFYSTGQNVESTLEIQFVGAYLTTTKSLLLEINLGGETLSYEVGANLTDNEWHYVSIIHERSRLLVNLDDLSKYFDIITENRNNFLYLDPLIYIGGLPNLNKECNLQPNAGIFGDDGCNQTFKRHFYNASKGACQTFTYSGCGGNGNNFNDPTSCLAECHKAGLRSYNFFIGCFKQFNYNGIDVLEELATGKDAAKYKGLFKEVPIGNKCQMETEHSISFTTSEARVKIIRSSNSTDFMLKITFRSKTDEGVLASGHIQISDSDYQWELHHTSSDVTFVVLVNDVYLRARSNENHLGWRTVALSSKGSTFTVTTTEESISSSLDANILFANVVLIGDSVSQESTGFIGCVKQIILDNSEIELRSIIGSYLASDDVIMDRCEVLSPCDWASTCGANVSCSLSHNFPVCNCEGTQFEGPNCLIAKYRKSCDEYHLLGFNKSGNFIIDLDGSGPIAPARVYCDFNSTGDTSTIISHNVPLKFVIRENDLQSFTMNVTYKDFDHEMLRRLINEALTCSQDVTIPCDKGNKILNGDAWFSSPWERRIDALDTEKCGHNFSLCECDSDTYVATIHNKRYLPVTSFTSLGDESSTMENSEIKFDLGQLICKSQRKEFQRATFPSAESYLVMPAWRKQDFMVKFRTTSESGSILYQPSLYPSIPSFQITLVSGSAIEFKYKSMQEERVVTFNMSYPLNAGDWNFIWIDAYSSYFRIIFNDQKHIMEIPKGGSLDMLDGIAVLGFIPQEYRSVDDSKLDSGFIGCIEGLTANGEEVNLRFLIRGSKNKGVSFGCEKSCDVNPCQNGGSCIEMWGSYLCSCENPYAHLGQDCENDINRNGVTFTSSDSELAYFNSTLINDNYNPLKENFTFNFKTNQKQAILFVAKDYIQNIAQIYLNNPLEVIMMFNYGRELKEVIVNTKDYALNEGQSVQIVVTRFEWATTLTLYSRRRTFSSTVDVGVSLLPEEEYSQYPYEVLPHLIEYQHSFTLPGKYFLMFLGGVRSSGMTSDLPGLVGCFRGLKIADKILELSNSANWHIGSSVKFGCISQCEGEKTLCHNGGKCVSGIENDSGFSCDCSGTSFFGEACNQETAYIFNGRDWLGIANWTLLYEDSFELEFAFSPNSESTNEGGNEEQLIIFVPFTKLNTSNKESLTIMINETKTLRIEAAINNKQFKAIYSLPIQMRVRRHLLLKYRENNTLDISIDKKPLDVVISDFENDQNDDTDNFGIMIGGMVDDDYIELEEFQSIGNYKGCISNVRISSSLMEYFPLTSYENGADFMRMGLPKLGSCAVLPHARAGPKFYDFSEIREWEHSEPQLQMIQVEKLSDEDSEVLSTTEADERIEEEAAIASAMWPWALVGCLIVLVIVIVLICLIQKYAALNSSKDPERPAAQPLVLHTTPPYSLQPTQYEDIPLLRNDPTVLKYPADSGFNSSPVEMQPETAQVTLELHESSGPAIASGQTPVEESSRRQATALNSVNRDSNSKLPFTNQLSSDSNTLRYIDSSMEEEPNLNKDSVDSALKERDMEPKLINTHNGALESDTCLADESIHENAQIVNELTGVEPSSSTSSSSSSYSSSSRNTNNSIPQSPQTIDIKQYFLKRQPSEPPVLPPRYK